LIKLNDDDRISSVEKIQKIEKVGEENASENNLPLPTDQSDEPQTDQAPPEEGDRE
jgi:hypothetical protein